MPSILQWRPSATNTLCFLVFVGQMQNYMMRGNLSILIVAMVKQAPTNGTLIAADDDNLLDWGEWERGLALSGFGYGYLFTQIIGGRMAEVFGIKLIYGMSLLLPG